MRKPPSSTCTSYPKIYFNQGIPIIYFNQGTPSSTSIRASPSSTSIRVPQQLLSSGYFTTSTSTSPQHLLQPEHPNIYHNQVPQHQIQPNTYFNQGTTTSTSTRFPNIYFTLIPTSITAPQPLHQPGHHDWMVPARKETGTKLPLERGQTHILKST